MSYSPMQVRQLVDFAGGLLDPRVYQDPELYELELEKLFGRCWLFLAHDTMIPKSGDFIQTYMGEDPVLVVRQRDGSVKAFLNQCRHRGMRICRADKGNIKAFTCTYHGWTYDIAGRLINVPHEEDGYHNELDKEAWGPIQVAQLYNYKGFWFGTWDESAPPFLEYLGDMAFYFDAWCDVFEGGTEVIDGPTRWVIDCNWKFASEQFASDLYHADISHASATMVMNPTFTEERAKQIVPPDIPVRQFASPNGHGTGFSIAGVLPGINTGSTAKDIQILNKFWEDLKVTATEKLGPTQGEQILGGGHHTIFPNFSFLGGSRTMRVWHPRGPNQIEVWVWINVPANAPDEVKLAMRRTSIRTFSPSGLLEQDDGENWNEIQKVLRGHVAKAFPFNMQMGLGHGEKNVLGLPGMTNYGYGEEAARHFYQRWSDLLSTTNWAELTELQRARGQMPDTEPANT
jgi:phenylpropionate dioxygenase-like ring-hydroxylating dioxygenase large terminal subunit